MSVWSTITEIHGLKYFASHLDPRQSTETDKMDLALVADYVYDDSGMGEKVLPFMRVGIGQHCILLDERSARELIAELEHFVLRPKFESAPPTQEETP